MRRLAFTPVVVALACSSSTEPGAAGRGVASGPDAAVARASATGADDPRPAYPAGVKSLRLKRSIAVRLHPDQASKSLGTVAADTRVAFRGAAPGPGCPRWVEIVPRGWVCERYLEPSPLPPAAVELPKLRPGEFVPGVYGKVVGDGAKAYRSAANVLRNRPARTLAGSVTVRRMAEVKVRGRTYWKTSTGELVDARKIAIHEPSRFAGLRMDAPQAPELPFAWVQSRKRPRAAVPVRAAPDPKARVLRKIEPRTVVALRHVPADGFVPVEGGWVARADLHVARTSEPPPELTPGERWIDIDLDEQVLVAYEGTTPSYATLVSTGSPKWPTALGIFRIWIKFAEADMSGQMGDEQPYSVATVPWTAFYAKDLALHTAYWHDRFGEPRSHGCVNLAPADARELYFWTHPGVPLGWSMANGIMERPGSIVRVRDGRTPYPEFKGYARLIYEQRRAARGADEPPYPPVSAATTADGGPAEGAPGTPAASQAGPGTPGVNADRPRVDVAARRGRPAEEGEGVRTTERDGDDLDDGTAADRVEGAPRDTDDGAAADRDDGIPPDRDAGAAADRDEGTGADGDAGAAADGDDHTDRPAASPPAVPLGGTAPAADPT